MDLTTLSPIALGFLGSLAAGSLTGIGAIPVLFGRLPSRATRDLSLGFAAGVMLAASFFSLIIPALDAAEARYDNGAVAPAIVCVAILLGMGAVALMNERLPHEHFATGREGPEAASLRRVWLFVIAITIHNFQRASPWASDLGRAESKAVCRSPWGLGCRTPLRGSPSLWLFWARAMPKGAHGASPR